MWAASVAVVSDRVFPEAALPDGAFGAALAGGGAVFGGGLLFGEVFFQGAPAGGVVVVAGGEVQMQWMWSGRTTQASLWKGARARVSLIDARREAISVTRRRSLRSSRLAVKT